jgi:hypothetical protein
MTVQEVPLKDATSVWITPAELIKYPTAWHDVADVHATPWRTLVVVTLLVGAASAHVEPFHVSIRAWPMPLPLVVEPTAWQEVVDLQDTAERLLLPLPLSALGITLHVVPFHDATRV